MIMDLDPTTHRCRGHMITMIENVFNNTVTVSLSLRGATRLGWDHRFKGSGTLPFALG